jgi:PKD repeat protein/DNA-binding MarR family transcriptional regulator
VAVLVIGGLVGIPLVAAHAFEPAAAPGSSCAMGMTVYADPGNGSAPLTVAFVLVYTISPVRTVAWDFGDGVAIAGPAPSFLTVEHRFALPGSYLIVVTATTAAGSGSCSLAIAVRPAPLLVQLDASPRTGPAPLTVRFSAAIFGGSGTFTVAVWSFGDGAVGSGSNLSYTYPNAGSYIARFTVEDVSGVSTNGTIRILVTSDPSLVGSGGPGLLPGWTALWVGLAAAGGVGVAAWWRSRAPRSVGVRRPRSVIEPPDGAMVPRRGPPGEPAPDDPAVRRPIADAAFGATPERSGATRPRAFRLNVRLHERVLLHLARVGVDGPAELPSLDRTQMGIAASAGIGRNQVSSILNRLMVAGVVSRELSHVQGQSKRLRVYRLTAAGEELARQIHEREGIAAHAPGAPE